MRLSRTIQKLCWLDSNPGCSSLSLDCFSPGSGSAMPGAVTPIRHTLAAWCTKSSPRLLSLDLKRFWQSRGGRCGASRNATAIAEHLLVPCLPRYGHMRLRSSTLSPHTIPAGMGCGRASAPAVDRAEYFFAPEEPLRSDAAPLEALIPLARSSTPAPQPCWQKIPLSPLTLASPRLQTLAFSSWRKAAECPKSSCAKNPAVFQTASIRSSDKTGESHSRAAIGEESAAPFRSVAWHEQIHEALTASRNQSPGTGHWLFLSLFLATRPAPERFNNALGELLRSASLQRIEEDVPTSWQMLVNLGGSPGEKIVCRPVPACAAPSSPAKPLPQMLPAHDAALCQVVPHPAKSCRKHPFLYGVQEAAGSNPAGPMSHEG